MKRLTIRTNEASISFECESVGDIVRRLAAIEDILGDEYEQDDLKAAMKLETEFQRHLKRFDIMPPKRNAMKAREQDG